MTKRYFFMRSVLLIIIILFGMGWMIRGHVHSNVMEWVKKNLNRNKPEMEATSMKSLAF